MNQNKPTSRRLALRPMSLAIQSLSLATASSIFIWSLGGGIESALPSLPIVAKAATKTEKAAEKNQDVAASSPTAIGNAPEAEIPSVKLNYMSTTWEAVIKDVAKHTQSQLVMDRVPKGRYTRRDSARYNRHDAVRILNKDIEPLGFRLIEKGDFLILIDLPSTRPRYAPAVLPHRQTDPPVQQAAATDSSPSPFERRVDTITRNDADAEDTSESPRPTARKTRPATDKGVRQVAHDEQASDGVPEELNDDPVADASHLVFRPRNRNVVDLSRQVYKTFKSRAQLISSGRNSLPAYRITTAAPADAKPGHPVARAEAHLVIAIDEANDELLIDGPKRDVDAAVKLLRTMDRSFDDEPVHLATTTPYVCQIADQLPAEFNRIRAARKAEQGEGREPVWVAQDEPLRPNGDRGVPGTGVIPNMPAGVGEVIGKLNAEVTIVPIPDLGALAVIGNEADVKQVMQVIRELEKLSEATAPQTHLLYLKNVDSESLSELLTTVYDRLTKFPGVATQPRQSAAILPINKPNALLIIAPKADLEQILDIAEELDQPVEPETEFQVFTLKHAIAAQVEEKIMAFYADRQNLGVKIFAVSDARGNAVVVRARPRDLDEIGSLIKKLDRDDPASVNNLRIFPLKNAVATELSAVINAAIQSVIAPPATATGGGLQGGLSQLGLPTPQVDEQFRTTRSSLLQMINSSNEKVRSGILSDIRVTPHSQTNSLLVSASEQSMMLIEELVKQLDRPTSTVSEIKVFTLANADAELMVQQLNALFNNQTQGQGGNQQRQNLGIALEGAADSSSSLVPLKFSVDKRTNSVIAVGAREALGVVEAILLRLDESDLRARQNVVIRLQNSQATLIAQSIGQFYQSQRDIAQAADPNLVSSVEQMEKEVVVVPDTTNNSLLLSATPRYFNTIESMILKLDAQPRQVIIQALLVEVELQNTDEFGVELGFQDPLQFARSTKDAPITFTTTSTLNATTTVQNNEVVSQSGSPGFNFNNPSLPLGNNLGTPNPGIVAAQALSNFSLGRVNSDLGFGGLVLSAGSDAVNVLIRALSAHRKITVLSRPQIRALDNQMAEIFSGQNIPVITGFTANGTTGVNTPTVTQRDAGVQLQVMPRITADGNVVMALYAQRSQYRQQGVPLSTDATGKTVTSPILDISRLQTTISVPTGNTVVIGGLINSRDESFTNKAPFLAEIPLIGHIFRYDSRTTRRVELLVFLTPRIITGALDEETIKEVEMGRIHFIESEAEELQGPLRAVPPEQVFNESSAPSPFDTGTRQTPPPPAPAADSGTLPPAPQPQADPSSAVIHDPEFSTVSARVKYTEEDNSNKVQQAKGSKIPSLFHKKPKKPAQVD